MKRISGELSLKPGNGGWLVTSRRFGDVFGPYPVERMADAADAAAIEAGYPGGYRDVPGAYDEAHGAAEAADEEIDG